MTPRETQLYMKNLLIALQRVHSFDIIHRDVKPSNFLYNRKEQKLVFIHLSLFSLFLIKSSVTCVIPVPDFF